jgi:hypothetical protein
MNESKNQLLKKVWLNTKSSLSKLFEYLILAAFASPTLFVYYGIKTNKNPNELIKALSIFDAAVLLLFLTIICAVYIFLQELVNSQSEATLQDIFGGLDGDFDKDGNFEGLAQTPNGNYRVNLELVTEETTAKVKAKANA